MIDSFLDGMKRRFPVAEKDVRLSGCLIGIDEKRGIAESFQRFELKENANNGLNLLQCIT